MEKSEKLNRYKEAILNWMKKGVELNTIRKGLEVDPEISNDDLGDAACDAMLEFGKDRLEGEFSSTKFFHGGDAS